MKSIFLSEGLVAVQSINETLGISTNLPILICMNEEDPLAEVPYDGLKLIRTTSRMENNIYCFLSPVSGILWFTEHKVWHYRSETNVFTDILGLLTTVADGDKLKKLLNLIEVDKGLSLQGNGMPQNILRGTIMSIMSVDAVATTDVSELHGVTSEIATLLLKANAKHDATGLAIKLYKAEETKDCLKRSVEAIEKTIEVYVDKLNKANVAGSSKIVESLKRCPPELFQKDGYKGYIVNLEDTKIVVRIKDVILEADTSSINNSEIHISPETRARHKMLYWPIGDIIIEIETTDGSTNFIPVNGYHPHVSGGRLCKDPRFNGMVTSHLGRGDLMGLCRNLRVFMSAYNAKSPHKSVGSQNIDYFFSKEECYGR